MDAVPAIYVSPELLREMAIRRADRDPAIPPSLSSRIETWFDYRQAYLALEDSKSMLDEKSRSWSSLPYGIKGGWCIRKASRDSLRPRTPPPSSDVISRMDVRARDWEVLHAMGR